jgi:hypothetical protein
VQSAATSPLHMVKNLVKGSSKESAAEPAEELQALRTRISELEGRLRKTRRSKKRRSATT